MNEKDDIILEFMREVRVAVPPAVIHWNLRDKHNITFTIKTLRRRLERLEEYGLLEVPYDPGPYYRITADGVDYLDGFLDAKELER